MDNNNLDYYLEQLRKEGSIYSQFFNDEAAVCFLKRGFAKKEDVQSNEVYKLVITEQGLSFVGFVKEQEYIEKERKREELDERAVKSAEASAEAAKESAKAASRGNIISILAIIISLISIILSIIQSYPLILSKILSK